MQRPQRRRVMTHLTHLTQVQRSPFTYAHDGLYCTGVRCVMCHASTTSVQTCYFCYFCYPPKGHQ